MEEEDLRLQCNEYNHGLCKPASNCGLIVICNAAAVVWTSSGNGKTAGCNVVAVVVVQWHYAANAMVQQFNLVTSTNSSSIQCCIHRVNSKKIGEIVQKLFFLVNIF